LKDGLYECGNVACYWTYSDQIDTLRGRLLETPLTAFGLLTSTISVYNVHSLWESTKGCQPICRLNTNLTLVESMESQSRYGDLFDCAFKNFDGWSTTNPASSVPRVYDELNISKNDLREQLKFNSLIKGASYVASDCHKRDGANSNRDGIVQQLRDAGFRVDGLSKCMHSVVPEGIILSRARDQGSKQVKIDAISRYMFNMAFENSIEPGYVSEKPFDAMMAGTVPVYLGDVEHLKSLLPHPKAAIFISDYPNIRSLVAYLAYLTTNQTAYEEHRNWRYNFTVEKNLENKPLLQTSPYCRICQWAVKQKQTKTEVSSDSHREKCTNVIKESFVGSDSIISSWWINLVGVVLVIVLFLLIRGR